MKNLNTYIIEKFKISKDIKEKPETFYSKFSIGQKCLCLATISGPKATTDNYLEVIEIIDIEKTEKHSLKNKEITVKFLTDTAEIKNQEITGKYSYDNDDFLCFTSKSIIYHLICNYDSLDYLNKLKSEKKFKYQEFEPASLTKETFKLGKMKEEDYNKIEKELTK